MKIFLPVFAALLSAMAVGYLVFLHSSKVAADDAFKKSVQTTQAEINSLLSENNDVTHADAESLRRLADTAKRIHDDRVVLAAMFAQKNGALSGEEQQASEENHQALVAEWKRRRDASIGLIAEADIDGKKHFESKEAEILTLHFQVECRRDFIREIEKYAPFSEADKDIVPRLQSEIAELSSK